MYFFQNSELREFTSDMFVFIEAPEEDYDHRSLFERLQEQKQKREFEFEEAHRLSKRFFTS